MRFRLLEPNQSHAYVEHYLTSSGDPLPPDDLRAYVDCATRAVGVFDRDGRMRAGYVLAGETASRCRIQLGPERWRELLARAGASEAIELNLVWLDPALRGGPLAAALWLRIALELMRLSRQTAIVYAVNIEKTGLVRLYREITVGHVEVQRPLDGAVLHYCWSTPGRFRMLPILYARRLLRRAVKPARDRLRA